MVDNMLNIAQSCRKFESAAWNTRIVAHCFNQTELGTLIEAAAQGAASLLDDAYCGGRGWREHIPEHMGLRTAIMGGHIECVKVMRARRNIQSNLNNSDMCMWAALSGQLEVLKWMRAQNPPCPWNALTCRAAARGHLEVLEWMRAQNPPCPEFTEL